MIPEEKLFKLLLSTIHSDYLLAESQIEAETDLATLENLENKLCGFNENIYEAIGAVKRKISELKNTPIE